MFTLLLVCLVNALGSFAHGHALEGQQSASPALSFQFSYSDGKPLAYASVYIYAPDSFTDADLTTVVEYQNGRTDAQGIFSFVPSRSGLWKLVVADNQGHRLELDVPYTLQALEAAPVTVQEGSRSKLLPALLGVSLLMNLALLGHFWQLRSNKKV